MIQICVLTKINSKRVGNLFKAKHRDWPPTLYESSDNLIIKFDRKLKHFKVSLTKPMNIAQQLFV